MTRVGVAAAVAMTLLAVGCEADTPRTAAPSVSSSPPSAGPGGGPSGGPSGTPSGGAATPRPPLPVLDAPGDATGTVWPVTAKGELSTVSADDPTLATPEATAAAFAREYLGLDGATAGRADTRRGVTRVMVSVGERFVTEVRVVGLLAAGRAPYGIAEAAAPDATILSPVPGEPSGSPATVALWTAQGDVEVDVRWADRRVEHSTLKNHGDGYRTAVVADVPAPRPGAVVARLRSGRRVVAVSAVPVLLMPAEGTYANHIAFYGVRDRRLARFEVVFAARRGRLVGWLTPPRPGGGVSSAAAGGPYPAWTQGEGTCAASVRYREPASGETVVAGPASGATASHPAWLGRTRLAYLINTCDAPPRVSLRVLDLRTGSDRVVRSLPGSVAITAGPEGRFVAWVHDDTLTRYDVANGRTVTVPPRRGCRWVSVDVFTGGELAAVEACGAAATLRRVTPDGRSRTVRGLPGPGRVAIGDTWDRVLLETERGVYVLWGGQPEVLVPDVSELAR